jgi:hypothetical protein
MNNREILAKEMADLKAKEAKIRAKRKQIRQKEMISLAKLYCKKEGFKTPAEALDFWNQIKRNHSVNDEVLVSLRKFADGLVWQENGAYWRTNDVKGLTQFMAQFRSENVN